MKKISLLVILFWITLSYSQKRPYTFDVSNFYGYIMEHDYGVAHLITDHPSGVILSYNQKTFGDEEWQALYNYPDVGFSFIYQNMKEEALGENYGVYAHINFFFLKRNINFRIGQGIAYNTNPYDKVSNYTNNAYGTHLLSTTFAMLNFKKENLIGNLGLQTGISFIHYSNANVKAPNLSTNTIAFNVGLNYQIDDNRSFEYIPFQRSKYSEPIAYNFVFRSGLNESDINGTGQFPFYIISAYADKRIGNRSGLQLGADVFFSNFLKELIKYESVAFPQRDISGDEDYKRVGIFAGHELFFGNTGVLTQLGYYIYYPFDFEGRVYERIGVKQYFGDKIFGAITLKAHGAKAEAVEFGIGVRL